MLLERSEKWSKQTEETASVNVERKVRNCPFCFANLANIQGCFCHSKKSGWEMIVSSWYGIT